MRLRPLLVTVLLLAGCASREVADQPAGDGGGDAQPLPVVPTPRPKPIQAELPALDREPTVGVLLAEGRSVTFTLLMPATLPGGQHIAAGPVTAAVAGSGLVIAGQRLDAESVPLATEAAAATFKATLTPPFGKAQTLKFAGQPLLHHDRGNGTVELIERIPMEGYLAGVVPVEMVPTWPLEALKAQAVAARSYACDKWLERHQQAWQLHWHFSRDMAYGGIRPAGAAQKAVAATRGQVLMHRGLPVPALFHASSGGATEAADHVWRDLTGADGRTPMAEVMPSVADDAARGGCTALKWLDSHWQWKADLPLAEVGDGLKEWAREHPERRLVFGPVSEVRIGSRNATGRVATVVVVHRPKGRSVETVLSGQDFRMATGPGTVRSTWWDRCITASAKGGTLVITGKGYGHGVGLSQVSAWQMAIQGSTATAILARFYPGADLQQRWR